MATISVMASQFSEQSEASSQEVTTEEAQNDQTESQLKVSDAIQSTFQVNLTFHSFLLEVVQINTTLSNYGELKEQFIPSISKNFKILLQRIISTNAP